MPQETDRKNCIEKVIENFHVDPRTGCKSKRKIKTLKCKSECSSSSQSESNSLNQTPFNYLIGTNKQTLRSLKPNGATSTNNNGNNKSKTCCKASKVKRRKMKLFCADGSTIMTDVSIIKRCTCSNECMINDDNENKQRMLRHSYHVQV